MPRHKSRISPNQPTVESTAVLAEAGTADANVEPATTPTPPLPQTPTSSKSPAGKLAVIVELTGAPGGATIDDLVAATGWQSHTVRAALSRLRRRGFTVDLATDDTGRKAYRLAPQEG